MSDINPLENSRLRMELAKSKEYLDNFMTDFKILFNYIDKRNTISIRWLKMLGFKFTNLITEYGYQQKPFYEFIKVR